MLALIGLVGMGGVTAINIWGDARQAASSHAVAAARDAHDVELRLQLLLLEARRFEKDFLLRRDEKSLTQHAATMGAIAQTLDTLAIAAGDRAAIAGTIADVRAGVAAYTASFTALAGYVRHVGLTENAGLLGELRLAVRNAEQQIVTVDAAKVQVSILLMRRHEKDFLARLDPRYIAELKAEMPKFAAALATVDLADTVRRDILGKLEIYQDKFNDLAEARLAQEAATRELSRIYAGFEPLGQQLTATFTALAKTANDDGALAATVTQRLTALTLAFVILVAGSLSWIIGRNIAGPIIAVTNAMTGLVKGDLDTPLPAEGRRDEIGKMVSALRSFRDSLLEADHLRRDQAAQRDKADTEKRGALVDMAKRIETEAGKAVAEVSKSATSMIVVAEEMSSLAGRTGASAQAAVTLGATALGNAQMVAAAAEELSASILEISNRVNQSTTVVTDAVGAVTDARTTILTLTERVGRIGAVADMIGEIAAKTNLLALNATIEAARAGDAGKGFAVVASEVKALATQTARSTDEIAGHLADVRKVTADVASAMQRIETTIEQVNIISGSIAAAVEQQGAATAEIARNVTETATSVNEMASRNTMVSHEAEQAGRYAAEVLSNSNGLQDAMHALRRTMTHAVRTSSSDVDRRHDARHLVNLTCRVERAGYPPQEAQLADLSERGARLLGLANAVIGSAGILHIIGLSRAISFRVVGLDRDEAGVAFANDAAAEQSVHALIATLAQRKAA